MITKEKITEVVFSVIDEINGQLPQERQLEKSIDATLIGASGSLDSLGFVFLIVASEKKIEEIFGTKVTLVDDDMFRSESPFQTVGKFIDYIFGVLNKEKNQ